MLGLCWDSPNLDILLITLKSCWIYLYKYLQQTVLAIALSAMVESSPPQKPSKAMAKEVPPVLEGDGIMAQSKPVAVLSQAVL